MLVYHIDSENQCQNVRIPGHNHLIQMLRMNNIRSVIHYPPHETHLAVRGITTEMQLCSVRSTVARLRTATT